MRTVIWPLSAPRFPSPPENIPVSGLAHESACYVIRGRFRGKPTNTAISSARGQLGQFYIAFANTAEPVFNDPPSSAQRAKLPITTDLMTALRIAYCHDVVGQQACADPVFHVR